MSQDSKNKVFGARVFEAMIKQVKGIGPSTAKNLVTFLKSEQIPLSFEVLKQIKPKLLKEKVKFSQKQIDELKKFAGEQLSGDFVANAVAKSSFFDSELFFKQEFDGLFNGFGIPAATIDIAWMRPEDHDPLIWCDSGEKRASNKLNRQARLLGYFDISCQVKEARFKKRKVDENNAVYDDEPKVLRDLKNCAGLKHKRSGFNQEGEFLCPPGFVPLTMILDLLFESKDLSCDKETEEILWNIYALQNPSASPFHYPLLRSICPSSAISYSNNAITLRLYIYVTRLLFSLISDSAIQMILSKINFLVKISHPITAPTHSKQLKRENTSNSLSKFSIEYLMQDIENEGHSSCSKNIPGLKNELYEYQTHTVQWMFEKEYGLGNLGLNSLFWGEFEWIDGGISFFFPMAGEFRLSRPPKVNGGILAEEMGLGKTVEILALIALSKAHDCSAQSEHRDNSESTLVLVPTTLVGQWWHEIQKHLNGLSAAVCTLFDIFESRQDADLDEESLQSWKLICNCKTPCSTGFRQYDSETCSSLLSKHDIVLSTYSNLQRKGRLPQVVHLKGILRNTSWKRIVLDECQEIRSLNSIISKECSQLIARNRWLVSGTPLVSSINDLHGELQFLQVWPFSLKKDGFWETKILKGWNECSMESYDLLKALCKAIIIRHSKEQKWLNGSDVVSLTKCSIICYGLQAETVEELFVQRYFDWFGGFQAEKISALPEDLSSSQGFIFKQYLYLVLRALTNTSLIDLSLLDRIFRYFNRKFHDSDVIGRKLSYQEIFIRLCNPNASRVGGLIRNTDRNYAILTKEMIDFRNEIESKSIAELRKEFYECAKEIFEGEKVSRLAVVDQIMNVKFGGAVQTIHENGFSALIAIMEGQSVHCPICICPIENPVLTLCAHAFCKGCIEYQVESNVQAHSQLRCAICRKKVDPAELMEIDLQSPKFSFSRADEENEFPGDGQEEKEQILGEETSERTVSLESAVEYCEPTSRESIESLCLRSNSSRDPAFPMIDPILLECIRSSSTEPSTKELALYKDIQTTLNTNPLEKFVVFSQFPRVLDRLKQFLSSKGLYSVQISGSISSSERMSAIHSFNTNPKINIFLLSIGTSCAGLTLTRASTLYFLDPCFQRADELQALNRIHRIGQTRDVRVIYLYMKNSIEERMLFLQQQSHSHSQEAQGQGESLTRSRICALFGYISNENQR